MRRRFEAAFAVAALALLAAVTLNFEAGGARTAALERARQISAARGQLDRLIVTYIGEQAAVDGFLDSGADADLERFGSGRDAERQAIFALRTVLAGQPRELADVEAVASGALAWRAAAETDVAAVRQGGSPAPGVDPDRAHRRTLFTELIDRIVLVQRDVASAQAVARVGFDAASGRVTLILYISLALAVGLLGALLLLVRRWVLTPLEVTLQAVEAVREGAVDTTVPSVGPPELASLGAHVDAMRLAVLSRGRAAMDAESQLRLLIDSVPDCAILRLHPDGRPATWSAAVERLTGYTAAQQLDRPTTGLDLPDAPSAEVLRAALAQASAGETVHARRRRRHADGSEIVVDSALSAIRGEAGEVLGFAVVARDVTAAVAAEQALSQAHEQLAERAARLQETTELQEATNRDLLAANQEMEAFSHTVSHDLRAPLRSISGFSRLLIEHHDHDLDPEAMHYLERISSNATRMGQLIDDLLAFSTLRQSSLAKTATPLADVVRSAWEEVDLANPEAPVVLDVAELPTLPVDPSLLRQVFVNLLGNAVKFSAGTSHPHLGIDCGADPEGSGQPVISVRDNGIGFDSARATKVFEVFARLHTDREYEGTGIGLSIVKRIITRHGGRIWAQAAPGHGAVFSFTLGPDTLPQPASTPASIPIQPSASTRPPVAVPTDVRG